MQTRATDVGWRTLRGIMPLSMMIYPPINYWGLVITHGSRLFQSFGNTKKLRLSQHCYSLIETHRPVWCCGHVKVNCLSIVEYEHSSSGKTLMRPRRTRSHRKSAWTAAWKGQIISETWIYNSHENASQTTSGRETYALTQRITYEL